jgi:hypothetical protein
MDTAVSIAHWLRDHQQPDGRICDPVHGEYGTYADGFAGLTFALMAMRADDPSWAAACRYSLAVARRRGRESEFDQLALLLLATKSEEGERRPGTAAHARALGGRDARGVALYAGHRLVSNNWIAMRALNYALRARLNKSHADRDQAARLWQRVLSWQLPDGLFVDSPGGEATPTTYHAKFCAMLALAISETECQDQAMRGALWRGLQALAGLVSPSGVLVPYGRSRNAIFGYAAGILALSRGARLFGRPEYRNVACRLHNRLRRFLRTDGHLPAVLNDGEAERADWDVYVSNPDYNAYAAAFLLLAQDDSQCDLPGLPGAGAASPQNKESADSRQPAISELGPLLTGLHGGRFIALSARGQTVPYGTPFFSDHRYYGMQPLWIEQNGEGLIAPSPYRWRGEEDRTSLVEPTANDWIPYISVGEELYCVRRYDQRYIRQTGRVVEVEADGQPEVYHAVPRWARAAQALVAHGSKRPVTVFHRRVLAGVRLRRRLLWDSGSGVLEATTQVIGHLPRGATLHQDSALVRNL